MIRPIVPCETHTLIIDSLYLVSPNRLLWLVDPGRIVIFLTSLFLIHNGCKRALRLDQDFKENPMAEGIIYQQ